METAWRHAQRARAGEGVGTIRRNRAGERSTARRIGRTAPVEAARAAQGRVQDARAVGGGHDDDVGLRAEAVHERQKLRHKPPLHLALCQR